MGTPAPSLRTDAGARPDVRRTDAHCPHHDDVRCHLHACIGNTSVVYTPIAGEQPLWDGCLAHRQVAAYLVSKLLGWNIVPRTWLRDGPFGEGMVQLWQETDPEQTTFDLVAVEDLPETGWKEVLEGQDESLIYEDTAALRRMAVFESRLRMWPLTYKITDG